MRNDEYDISIEEFDAPYEEHKFSDRYNREKELNKKVYMYHLKPVKRLPAFVIAAAVALLIAAPFAVNAATHGEFFDNIWGKSGRDDVPAHTEILYEAEKDTYTTIYYPQREYVEIDPSDAEHLIGGNVETLNITEEVDGTIITVLSVVRDERASVIEFTLYKPGGVDALNYSEIDNESKGAYPADDATFIMEIGTYGGFIYVDLERSTDDVLYCYGYTFGLPNIVIHKLPCTYAEMCAASLAGDHDEMDRIAKERTVSSIQVPYKDALATTVFINPEGGTVEISPISLKFDMYVGLGLDYAAACDPYSIYSLHINYKDGTTYIVDEHNNFDHQLFDVDIANFSYARSHDTYQMIVFNRLVDVENVESITINGVNYTR